MAPARARVWLVCPRVDHARTTASVLASEFTVEVVPEGASALERLSRDGPPDALLIASEVQDVTGEALCRRMRERYAPDALSILMMGGNGGPAAIDAGANDWLALDSEAWALRARLRTLVRIAQLGRREDTPLTTLFEEAPAFMAHVSGPTHVFDMANREYVRLVGDRPLLGKTVREALPELQDQQFFGLLDRVFETGEPFVAREMVARLERREDDAPYNVIVNFVFHPTRNPNGTVDGILIHGVEVSDLVRAREQAFEAERGQRALLDALAAQSMVFMAILRGPELVFEMANARYAALLGGREVVGKPLLEAAPELKGQGFDELLRRVMETGEPFIGREVAVTLARPDVGRLEEALVSFVYQPVRGARGDYDAVLVAGIEVTSEIRARQEVLKRLAFEQQLIGIVGHDLRSPLAAVRMSAAQLLTGGTSHEGLSPAQVRAIERVDRGARRIQSVLASLLDFTRARSEYGFPLSPTSGDLDSTARKVIDEVRAAYPQRTVNYFHSGDTAGCFDAERLEQVVANLIENALKYGAPDVPVQVSCDGDGSIVRLSVINRGNPIPPELVDRLFEPFVRGPQSADMIRVSMGLGLYIVREIIKAHGGTIEVTSTEEAGTEFRMTLPKRGPDGPDGID